MVDYNKILIIHIPRNGSTCIGLTRFNGENDENSIISDARNFKKMREGRFDSLIELKNKINLQEFNIISIVRNPYTRAFSLYKRYLELIKFSKDEKSFIQFLNVLKNSLPYHPIARQLLHKTQSWFLYDQNNTIDVDAKIYKLENLDQLKIDLEIENLFHRNRLKFDSEDLIDSYILNSEYVASNKNNPDEIIFKASKASYGEMYLQNLSESEREKIINNIPFSEFKIILKNKIKRRSYTTQEMLNSYSEECINLVKEIYAEDFDNFNYSRNFEDAI